MSEEDYEIVDNDYDVENQTTIDFEENKPLISKQVKTKEQVKPKEQTKEHKIDIQEDLSTQLKTTQLKTTQLKTTQLQLEPINLELEPVNRDFENELCIYILCPTLLYLICYSTVLVLFT
jgi:hypothetical protein